MGFRLVPKSVTWNELELHNDHQPSLSVLRAICAFFSQRKCLTSHLISIRLIN